jgi:hypothetical protein
MYKQRKKRRENDFNYILKRFRINVKQKRFSFVSFNIYKIVQFLNIVSTLFHFDCIFRTLGQSYRNSKGTRQEFKKNIIKII